ncbi:hypothetical protein ACQWU4_01210 [Chryseobacterium sp. MIQD13]|uniref:hypothetical protein n=1 Tax=Chryseobacterium sp. MIQD13 TaxID=3422310 RepID=UPI003D2B8438
MNARLLFLVEQRVNRAIQLLSEFLSGNTNDLHLSEKQCNDYIQLVIKAYAALFRTLDILQDDFSYSGREINFRFDGGDIYSEPLENKIISYLDKTIRSASGTSSDSGYSVVPLHISFCKNFSDMSAVFGLCIMDHSAKTAQGFLYEFTVNLRQINFCTSSLYYLDDVLLKFKADPSIKMRNLSKMNDISYLQFQKDCRQYFGTTFYDFTIKLKIIDVVEDLMFSQLMIKEIVYKHRFAEYSNMYKFFHKIYNFPFKNITRFYFMERV